MLLVSALRYVVRRYTGITDEQAGLNFANKKNQNSKAKHFQVSILIKNWLSYTH